MLESTEKGGVRNSIRNCLTVFQNDPLLSGAIAKNLLTERTDIIKPIGYHRTGTAITDTDMNYLLLYLEETYGLTSEKKIAAAIGIVANENGYHPIRDYLNGLTWDGTERIRTCLHHFLGADSDQYTYEALRLFLLGAIHRAFHPGCKFEIMLCLVGGQGAGKSTFFRLLALKDEWFSDDLRKLDDDNVYGYILHPTIRNKLKLDPEAAEIVRRVFDEALLGSNTSEIALGLNEDNIPTPGQYFRSNHPDKKKFSRMSEKISWTASMVYKILTSYVYTGATVGHKRKSGGVGSRKSIAQDQEDWIIVEGMHEAIVSKKEFELAQAVIRGGEKKPERKQKLYPLKGLVCCGNCKRAMTRRKLRNGSVFYQCHHSTHDRDTECPVGERYSEITLEAVAYNAIGQFLMLAEKQAVQNREVGNLRKTATPTSQNLRHMLSESL